jgi:hypothetical protein
MFNKIAFANSLSILAAIFYIVFYLLSLVAPKFFMFLFNAQFFGANVASLMPQQFSLGNFLGTLVAVVVVAWLGGYLLVVLYNRFSRQ